VTTSRILYPLETPDQPKKYAQGSSVDKTTGSVGNTFFGIAGAAVGAAVVIGGTAALFVKDVQGETSFLDLAGNNRPQIRAHLSKETSPACPRCPNTKQSFLQS